MCVWVNVGKCMKARKIWLTGDIVSHRSHSGGKRSNRRGSKRVRTHGHSKMAIRIFSWAILQMNDVYSCITYANDGCYCLVGSVSLKKWKILKMARVLSSQSFAANFWTSGFLEDHGLCDWGLSMTSSSLLNLQVESAVFVSVWVTIWSGFAFFPSIGSRGVLGRLTWSHGIWVNSIQMGSLFRVCCQRRHHSLVNQHSYGK